MDWNHHEMLAYPPGDQSLPNTSAPFNRYDHFQSSNYLSANPYISADDYMAPPNDLMPYGGEFVSNSDTSHLRPMKLNTHPMMDFPHAHWNHSTLAGRNKMSYSSNTPTVSTRDSMSPMLPDERCGMFLPPEKMYGSPTASQASFPPNCTGVSLSDVQNTSDNIPDEHIALATIQDLSAGSDHTDLVVDTGLPTPSSETVVAVGDVDQVMKLEDESDCQEDNSGDYNPSNRRSSRRRSKPTGSRPAAGHKRELSKSESSKNKVTKPSTARQSQFSPKKTKTLSPTACPQCNLECKSEAGREKHVQKEHVRPFSCIFERYGCKATFGAKNEWKRHCSTQHLRLSFYRCDVGACVPQNPQEHQHLPGWDLPIAAQANCNDFNRKDLFIQHHRRMHAPDGIKDKDASQEAQDRFKALCERAAIRCRVSARAPPPRTICGLCEAKGCPVVFEGPRAWETRMEHVGRHLENDKGEKMQWVEDTHLKQWLIDEGLIQQNSRGEWRLSDHTRSEEGRGSRRSSNQ